MSLPASSNPKPWVFLFVGPILRQRTASNHVLAVRTRNVTTAKLALKTSRANPTLLIVHSLLNWTHLRNQHKRGRAHNRHQHSFQFCHPNSSYAHRKSKIWNRRVRQHKAARMVHARRGYFASLTYAHLLMVKIRLQAILQKAKCPHQ